MRLRLPLIWFLLLGAGFAVAVVPPLRAAEGKPPNVLFIVADDLRPTLGCYGDTLARSPNVDALAARGLVFNRAYCQMSICAPSRSSFFAGRRPDTTRVYGFGEGALRRNLGPALVTLPQHFKNHGYHTQSVGKMFDRGDDPDSWSVPSHRSKLPWKFPRPEHRWDSELPDDQFLDFDTREQSLQALRERAADRARPFFLAVGIKNPHLPFHTPKRFWEPLAAARIDLGTFLNHPQSRTNLGEARDHGLKPPLTDADADLLVRGYHAAIGHMDEQVGRLLAELDRLGLRENTVVVFLGDHGFHLGENGFWAKRTNHEWGTRVPLIVSAPTASAGKTTDALVELVDLYPSLAEICGLPPTENLEGVSFRPLLDDPRRPWKRAAFSQMARTESTVRTARWRLVAARSEPAEYSPTALYDHEGDPGERHNLIAAPEHAGTVRELLALLQAGWKAALPPKPE